MRYSGLVLKNIIGWTLILVAGVAGPLVPGPGGIPLFLLGFTLISFPGKRKISARVLRGGRISLRGRAIPLGILSVSLVIPAVVIGFFRNQLGFLPSACKQIPGVAAAYLLGATCVALLAYGMILIPNLVLRIMPQIRRRVRPWLRHYHVRLLPPRYRRRLANEHGTGPIRLKGEIVSYLKKRHRPTPTPESN